MSTDPMREAGPARLLLPPIVVAIAVFLLDQATKRLIIATLDLHESVTIVDGLFNIVHARNPGAAFSMLAGAPPWFRGPFFVTITLAAVVIVLSVIRRLPAEDRLLRLALGGVLGGALGNLCDRLRYGEVIDFIDVHWQGHHWPAFNIADSSISVAVVAVVLQTLFASAREPRSPDSEKAPSP